MLARTAACQHTYWFLTKTLFNLETVEAARILNFTLANIGVIDPQASTVLIILLLVLMLFSFIVSGAEVAYFSLTNKDINLLKTKQQTPYKRVVDLLEEPKALLASLLIANSFFNIAIIIISNILLDVTLSQFNFALLLVF